MITSLAIAVISLVALLGFKKIPEPVLILRAGIAGIMLHRGA